MTMLLTHFNANKQNIKLLFIVCTPTEYRLGLADIAMHYHLFLIIAAQAQFVLYRN